MPVQYQSDPMAMPKLPATQSGFSPSGKQSSQNISQGPAPINGGGVNESAAGASMGPQPSSGTQQTPGGMFGNITENRYQPSGNRPSFFNNGSGGSAAPSFTPSGPAPGMNQNATNWNTNNGPIDTGVDSFRQFGDQYYNHTMGRMRGDIEDRNSQLAQSLVNRGLQPGTEAYNAEMQRMDQRNNDLMSATALGAEQLGLQAQNQYFGQEMSNNQYDLAQAMQNYNQQFGYDNMQNQRDMTQIGADAQIGSARIGAAGAGNVANINNQGQNYRADLANALGINQLNESARVSDMNNILQSQGMDQNYMLGLLGQYNNMMNTGINQFNAQQNANNMWYNQAGQMANNAPGVIFNANNSYVGDQIGANANHMNAIGSDNQMYSSMLGGALSMFSDHRVKENIELVDIVDGINVYEFDYIDKTMGAGRYRGVMAHEIMENYPDAVAYSSDLMVVDYSKLPVDMEVVR